jgi:hypothetical protein
MNWHTCWLAGHGKCGGGIDRHHLLNRGKFTGVKAKKSKAFRDSLNLLLVPVCNAHNAYTKQADCTWARKILLEKLIDERGLEYVEWAVNEVLSKVKVRSNYSDMEIDAILSTKSLRTTPDTF